MVCPVRVVSWNLIFRSAAVARRQGGLLRELKPDLALLQEVNLGAAGTLQQAAGADWLVCAADLRARAPDDRTVRSRGVAIAGYGPVPRAWLAADVPLPERAPADRQNPPRDLRSRLTPKLLGCLSGYLRVRHSRTVLS